MRTSVFLKPASPTRQKVCVTKPEQRLRIVALFSLRDIPVLWAKGLIVLFLLAWASLLKVIWGRVIRALYPWPYKWGFSGRMETQYPLAWLPGSELLWKQARKEIKFADNFLILGWSCNLRLRSWGGPISSWQYPPGVELLLCWAEGWELVVTHIPQTLTIIIEI